MRNSLVKLSAIVDKHVAAAIKEYGVSPELYGEDPEPPVRSKFTILDEQPLYYEHLDDSDIIISTPPSRGEGVSASPHTLPPGWTLGEIVEDRVPTRDDLHATSRKTLFVHGVGFRGESSHQAKSTFPKLPLIDAATPLVMRTHERSAGVWGYSDSEMGGIRSFRIQQSMLEEVYSRKRRNIHLSSILGTSFGRILAEKVYAYAEKTWSIAYNMTERQFARCVYVEHEDQMPIPPVHVLGIHQHLRLYTTDARVLEVREAIKQGTI